MYDTKSSSTLLSFHDGGRKLCLCVCIKISNSLPSHMAGRSPSIDCSKASPVGPLSPSSLDSSMHA